LLKENVEKEFIIVKIIARKNNDIGFTL